MRTHALARTHVTLCLILPLASYRNRREGVSFVKGNCFDIDVAAATACCRYDRIYIGAGCPESKKNFFFSLLADDGIMVAPIDDSNCLVRIRRQCRNVFTVTHMYEASLSPTQSITDFLKRFVACHSMI